MDTSNNEILDYRKLLGGQFFVGRKSLWILYFAFFVISSIAVYSSSAKEIINSYESSAMNPALKHICFYLLGFVLVWGISRLKPYSIRRFGTLTYFGGMLLLYVLLYTHPVTLNQATRWVLFLGLTLQPSEFFKLSLPLFGAFIALWVHKSPYSDKGPYIVYLVWILLGFVLLGKESASTAIFIVVYSFIFTLIMRVPWRYLWRLYITGAVMMVIGLVAVFFIPKEYLPDRFSTWTSRIENIGEPLPTDKFVDDYRQAQYSQIAISNSELMGVGIGHSKIKQVLPMANSDLIFAIIVEEFGILGIIAVLSLYISLLVIVRKMARDEKSLYRRILILGIGILIPLQAFVNIAVVAGIFMTGQTLPMISAGGSSLIMGSIAFGILLSISNQQGKAKRVSQEAAKHGIELDEVNTASIN